VDPGIRTFIADTSAVFFHSQLHEIFPGHRAIYMLRDPRDCLASAQRQGGDFDAAEAARRLQHHAFRRPGNTILRYGQLDPAYIAQLTREAAGIWTRPADVRKALQ